MDTALPITQLDPIGNNHFHGVGNVFEPYLGKLPQLSRIDPYEKRNNSNFDLPEEYKGKNLYLRDTIEDHTFTSKQTYMSKYILPIYATEQLHMQWETFEKNAHMLDLAPYQTPGHLVTQRRTVRRASLVRRNIMAEFEQGFLGKPMGRISFLAAIDQFSDALQETINQEGMRTLCTGHRYQQAFLREMPGMSSDKITQYILDQDIERFGIVQTTKNGLAKLDMLISKEMAQWGGGADCFLIPEEISIYATIVRKEVTDYDKAGPLGPARVNNLPDGRLVATAGTMGTLDRAEPMHMIRTAPTFIVKNQMVEGVSEAESQQLARVRQIGEYYFMGDEVDDYTKYRSIERSIQLFDMEKNDMVTIGIADALKNAPIWDANGDLKAPVYDDKVRKQDLDEDFLVYLTSEKNRYGGSENRSRYAVRYIFDISPEFLSARRVLNGGESLKAAIRSSGADLSDDNAVVSLVGADSLFKTGTFGIEDSLGGILDRLRDTTVQVPVVPESSRELDGDMQSEFNQQQMRTGGPRVRDFNPIGSSLSQTEIDNAFFQTLMTRVPGSKRTEIQSIINSEGSVLQRAEQIKGKMFEYVDSNVSDMKFKDRAPVLHWFNERVKQYSEVSGSVGGVEKQKVEGEVKFMRPGLDLTGSGYRYLYSASAEPIRSSLEQFSLFRIANDAARSVRNQPSLRSASSTRNEEDGFGLAGIGMFQRENNELRSTGPVKSGLDFSGLQRHLDALIAIGATREQQIHSLLYLMTRVNLNRMLGFVNRNVMIPMNFLLFRPHIQLLTRGIIKCAMNGGTGLTFMGNSNLQMSWETGRKMALMHYTTHFRSVVIYPKNLYVQPDVYVQDYEGGMNTRFYSEETYHMANLDDLKNSIICAPIPIEETNFPRHLNISGRHYGSHSSGLSSRAEFEQLHYSTAARINQIFRFTDASRQGSDEPILSVNRHHWNLICQQGHQQNFNKTSNQYDKIIKTKGHLHNTYPGVARIWKGALEILKDK